MQFKGTVIKKPIGVGSKSEHHGVVLVTDTGEFVLRRQGGNPFSDPAQDQLVGKTITAEGTVRGTTLIMSDWRGE
ncbi:MAG: hypothetical protein ACREJU_17715 [Nitrospiraceae bacterium]